MFNALDEDRKNSPSHHVAEMVAYFGLPPEEFLHRSEVTRNVFNEHGESYYLVMSPWPSQTPNAINSIDLHLGEWLGAGGVDIPPISLEGSEENLGGRNKEGFLHFMRSMLRWLPEERKSVRELLDDPWLNERV